MSALIAKLVQRPIVAEQLLKHLNDPACGAQVLFFGTVRKTNHGRRVRALEYDAHASLAERTLQSICQEAGARYDQEARIITIHRVGRLEVGEISVGIGVSAAHRHEAYDASRYIIEELKRRAPIWKKEFYEDGDSEWLKGCAHVGAAAKRTI